MPYQKGTGKSVVVALGGNALGNTPQEQYELVQDTAKHIVDMVAEGINVIVTHGNGPQVGMINNAFAYASAHDGKTPEMPFPEAGAMSQGYIGYHLSQAVLSEMKRRGIMRSTANVVTQTVVYPDDPAFQNPTKPVGAFLTEEEARRKAEETGWTYKEDAGRGWRQVVASPKPRRIVESDAIRDLFEAGYIVVCTGGGGVPVFEHDDTYEGVPAVIDKDRSAAMMAATFKADMLVIAHRRGQGGRELRQARPGRHRRHGRRPGQAVHRGGPVRPRLDASQGGGVPGVRGGLPAGPRPDHQPGEGRRGPARRDRHHHHGIGRLKRRRAMPSL